jgi:lipid A ethanolaminephosphotransferase
MLFAKDGGGTAGLPVQFAPLSIGMAAGWTLTTHLPPPRSAVMWKPEAPKAKHIVLLVDESVRGDYIDLNRQNPYTPALASHGSRVIDFGPAASGGNCSHYSNAILRFVGTPPTIGRDLFSHPTIWQFAKQAGYRTIFIDAQAGFMRNKGQMQNFMTLKEMKDIDSYQAIDSSVPAQALDDALLDALIKALQSSEPVFVYANKNGAHFPYDRNYPESESKFRPTMSEAGDALTTRVNSYRNAIWWTVDRFFDRLFRTLTLDNTVILYTSDHGQVLRPGRFSHCSIDDPDPREALVPLFVATDSDTLRSQFQGGAALNRGRASHFSITPTALELMGYARADIARLQGISLLQPSASAARFTTGDIFGLFTRKTRWHDIDLHASYLETSSPARATAK